MKKLLMIAAALAMTAIAAQANDMEKIKAVAENAVKQTAEGVPGHKEAEKTAEKTAEKRSDDVKVSETAAKQ